MGRRPDRESAEKHVAGSLQARLERLEIELADARRREAELRQVLDLVPAFVYCVDEDGRILLANKALANAFGLDAHEVCGRLISDVDPDPDQAQCTLRNCREAIQRNEATIAPEREIVDSQGNRRIIQSTAIPYCAADTGKPAILGVSVDLTEHVELQQRVIKSRQAVIFSMARLAESRDEDTGKHLERIGAFVEILAGQLSCMRSDIDNDWVRTVSITAALHDIGKVGIPDTVLRKPGPLTDEERRVMQRHTYIGGDTLLDIKRKWQDDLFICTAAEIALSHHERWDGTGYPYGLSGQDIPLAARVVALADVYDALRSKRVYKEAMTHEAACKLIRKGSGSHFDPDIVKAFDAVEQQFLRTADRVSAH